MAFDIAEEEKEFAAEEEGIDLPILKANDDPALDAENKPVTIRVCGMNSETYRKATEWQRKTVRARGGRKMTPKEETAMQSEFIARCCKGWSGFTDRKESVPFSTDAATKMFQRLPHVERQVTQAVGNHDFFQPKSSS